MTPNQMLDLYRRRFKMTKRERTRAIRLFAGSPLGTSQVAEVLNLSEREVRAVYGEVRGGKFNPATLPDVVHLRYLRKIGARLDRDALAQVVSQGTSQATVAAFMGISRQRLHQLLEEE